MAVTTEVDVRYRDLDTLSHVNNAVYGTYVEEGRTAYVDEVFETTLADFGFVIAHLEIDFERRVTLGDTVTVTTEVPRLGESSVPMTYELAVDGERVATAETTLVFLDADSGEPRPIPDRVRERIGEHEEL